MIAGNRKPVVKVGLVCNRIKLTYHPPGVANQSNFQIAPGFSRNPDRARRGSTSAQK
jgi:hypothetical protein